MNNGANDLILSVDQVVKRYGNLVPVDHVSFSVNRGEILGFLGPNGAGKTTTIRMIMGITVPDEGTVRFHGIGTNDGEIPKDRVGYLPEERGLYRESRVIDILVFLGTLKGIPAKEARAKGMEWLDRFGLGEYAKAKVSQLSKGMAQKVQFISAIIHEPDLVVLDEPFSGLDPVNQELFKAEILKLAARGTAVLLSSHQMNLVEELCERIFLIHRGKRVVYGTLREVKAEYGVQRVRLHASEGAWRPPDSPLIESAAREGDGWTLHLERGVAPLQFLRSLPPDAPIEEISVSRISLHDIFLRIAKGEEAA